jgi:hypothetical protein
MRMTLNYFVRWQCKWDLQWLLQVVLVVAANQQMRSTTNILIFNLAVADLLFIVFCVPFTATDYVLPFWPFGDIWCKIVQYLIVVTAYASVYTLVLMSLDRFLAVVHPLASMSVSPNYVCNTAEKSSPTSEHAILHYNNQIPPPPSINAGFPHGNRKHNSNHSVVCYENTQVLDFSDNCVVSEKVNCQFYEYSFFGN